MITSPAKYVTDLKVAPAPFSFFLPASVNALHHEAINCLLYMAGDIASSRLARATDRHNAHV